MNLTNIFIWVCIVFCFGLAWLALEADQSYWEQQRQKYKSPVEVSNVDGCKIYKQYVKDKGFILINSCGGVTQ